MKKLLLTAGALALAAGAANAQVACPIKIGAPAPLSAPGAVTGGEAMRDAMAIVRTVNTASLTDTPIEMVGRMREGLSYLELWANTEW